MTAAARRTMLYATGIFIRAIIIAAVIVVAVTKPGSRRFYAASANGDSIIQIR